MHIAHRGAERGWQQIALETTHRGGEEKMAENACKLLTGKEFIPGKNIFNKVKGRLPQLSEGRANVSVRFRKDQTVQAEGSKQKEE